MPTWCVSWQTWFGGDEHELHFFNSKKQGELDFVIAQNGKVIPIEVKSGKDYERHNALSLPACEIRPCRSGPAMAGYRLCAVIADFL